MAARRRNPNESDLQRVIVNKDVSKVDSLVQRRPGLETSSILRTMSCFANMRAQSCGKNATPLIAAIHLGEEVMCRYLVKEGANVNLGNLDGVNPLCIALMQKHYKIAEMLIESGANVHEVDGGGRAPMYHAIVKGSPISIVKAILSAGFPKDGIIHFNDLTEVRPLTRAIGVRNIPVLKFILEQNVNVNFRVAEGTTSLTQALRQRPANPEIVKLLIDYGANVEGLFLNEAPPLYLAVQFDDTTILKMLIGAGANVNRLFTPTKYAYNLVAYMPYTTALQLAVMDNLQATKLLLRNGADINARNPINNGTVLHILFGCSIREFNEKQKIVHQKIIRYILEKGADKSIRDFLGNLPIHWIFSSENWIALEEYIKCGSNINETVCSVYGSIFTYVLDNQHVNLVKLCLAYGADCFKSFKRDSIYNYMLKCGNQQILKLFWEHNYPLDKNPVGEVVKSSPRISSLFDAQQQFMKGIVNNDPELVKNSLKLGAVVNCHYKDEDPPIHLCSANGSLELVKVLLDNGATVSTVGASGYTALHLAARGGHLEICKLLLRHGACLNYRGSEALTPRKLAQSAGHAHVVDLLRSASRLFTMLGSNNQDVVDSIKKRFGSEDFHVYMNCVNCRGNTLLGEALRLKLADVSETLMSLRLKAA